MVKHAILSYGIAIMLLGAFIVSNKVEGVIENKYQTVRFADTVYYLTITGKPLEVSKYTYHKFQINDFFKQGILE